MIFVCHYHDARLIVKLGKISFDLHLESEVTGHITSIYVTRKSLKTIPYCVPEVCHLTSLYCQRIFLTLPALRFVDPPEIISHADVIAPLLVCTSIRILRGERTVLLLCLWLEYNCWRESHANHLLTLDGARIHIGKNVFVAPYIYTAGHPLDFNRGNEGLKFAFPVTIGNNVWIGVCVVILPVVSIGNNNLIGAGSYRKWSSQSVSRW